jgi:hypothetical protein
MPSPRYKPHIKTSRASGVNLHTNRVSVASLKFSNLLPRVYGNRHQAASSVVHLNLHPANKLSLRPQYSEQPKVRTWVCSLTSGSSNSRISRCQHSPIYLRCNQRSRLRSRLPLRQTLRCHLHIKYLVCRTMQLAGWRLTAK